MSTLRYDVPEDEYHADRTTLSSTGAKTLLRSPARFRHNQAHPKNSAAFDVGRLFHALVLDQPHPYSVKNFPGNTKAGKEEAADAEANGLTLITLADWKTAHGMATAVRRHRRAMNLLRDGHAEVSAYGTDHDTGVPMRGRFDYLRDDGLLIDLKSTTNADPAHFARDIAKYLYHVQAAWYLELLGDTDGLHDFVFIAVEKEPPHLVSLIRLDDDALTLGHDLAAQACRTYRDCALFDTWPDWTHGDDDIRTVSLPPWAFYTDTDQEMNL